MEQKDYRLAAIMYTDIAGFSRMMEKDEAGTLKLLSWHNSLIASIAESRNGTVIKTIGDANLVDFRNTVDAMRAAVEIQEKILERNATEVEKGVEPLLVRIGVHLGDIYFFENDALGEGINIAARLQALARPGCICISQDVHNLVRNKFEYKSRPLGLVPLKNISKEIVAFELESGNVRFLPEQERFSADAGAKNTGTADRDYSVDGSKGLLAEIRASIMDDIRREGRRLTVREAREKYGYYGVEAAEVIATLVESGILVRESPGYPPGGGIRDPSQNRGASNVSSEIGRSIENAVHGIVSEIERSIGTAGKPRTGDSGETREKHGNIQIHLEGEDIKRIVRAGKKGWKSSPRGTDADGEVRERPSAFELYRRKLAAKAEKLKTGFSGHLVSYLAVNAGLWFINLSTSPGFLWAAIVSASWGIGLVSHMAEIRRASRQAAEIDALPELDAGKVAEYKSINKERDAMSGHLVSSITVPFLLFVINMLTSPGTLWFLIPSAALTFALAIHAATWFTSMPSRVKRFFTALGVPEGRRGLDSARRSRESAKAELGTYADQYREAENAMRELESALEATQDPSAAETKADLQRYLGQVRLLAQSAHEIDRIIEAMPMDALSRDKAALVKKSAAATESLKKEYAAGIAEVEKQEASWQELRDQKEVLALRLTSSVNQLNQMRLDLARVRAAGAGEGPMPGDSALARIRDRADELGRYIEDLRAGHIEAQADPFAELERLAALEDHSRLEDHSQAASGVQR